MATKNIDSRIVCEKLTSGQHSGWWCASINGMGVYARVKEDAINRLKNVLYCAGYVL